MSNYLGQTVQKQYSNSPTLLAILDDFDQCANAAAFSAQFLTNVWDISQAQGFGLDIWGRILGQSRYVLVAQTPGKNMGFQANPTTGHSNWKPWSVAPFYGGAAAGTVAFALADAYYRQLLIVKAAANLADCDVPSLNALMRSMFGARGKCYVGYDLDFPMHIGYHFEFTPTTVEKTIIESGLFPVPAGMTVKYIYQTLTYAPFGFAGGNLGANPKFVSAFNQKPFYSK